MASPHGALTGPQLEIMEIIWSRGQAGAAAADVWQALSAQREVARTTVLTMMSRLENRGWLVRKETPQGLRYVAGRGKEETTGLLAAHFVDEMFDGSAAEMVRSLLGSHPIKPEEIRRLRKILDEFEKGNRP